MASLRLKPGADGKRRATSFAELPKMFAGGGPVQPALFEPTRTGQDPEAVYKGDPHPERAFEWAPIPSQDLPGPVVQHPR
jgi:hypothetical protein